MLSKTSKRRLTLISAVLIGIESFIVVVKSTIYFMYSWLLSLIEIEAECRWNSHLHQEWQVINAKRQQFVESDAFAGWLASSGGNWYDSLFRDLLIVVFALLFILSLIAILTWLKWVCTTKILSKKRSKNQKASA